MVVSVRVLFSVLTSSVRGHSNCTCSFSTNKVVVDNWLRAGFGASNIVAHGVKASLGWVNFDDDLKLLFTSRQLVFPELAKRFALLK